MFRFLTKPCPAESLSGCIEMALERGFEVTQRFFARIGDFGPGLLAEKIAVRMPAARAASSGS